MTSGSQESRIRAMAWCTAASRSRNAAGPCGRGTSTRAKWFPSSARGRSSGGRRLTGTIQATRSSPASRRCRSGEPARCRASAPHTSVTQTSFTVVPVRAATAFRSASGSGSLHATAFAMPGRPSSAVRGLVHRLTVSRPTAVLSAVTSGRAPRPGTGCRTLGRPTRAESPGRCPSRGSSSPSMSWVERMPSAIEWWNRVTTALPPA